MSTNGKSRDELARQANEVRSRLIDTVDRLARKRRDALDVRVQIDRHVRQIVVVGAVLVVAAAATVGVVVHRIVTADGRRGRQRWTLAKDVWRHPDRALKGERKSLAEQVLRSLLVSLATAVVTVPARRFLVELVEASSADAPTTAP